MAEWKKGSSCQSVCWPLQNLGSFVFCFACDAVCLASIALIRVEKLLDLQAPDLTLSRFLGSPVKKELVEGGSVPDLQGPDLSLSRFLESPLKKSEPSEGSSGTIPTLSVSCASTGPISSASFIPAPPSLFGDNSQDSLVARLDVSTLLSITVICWWGAGWVCVCVCFLQLCDQVFPWFFCGWPPKDVWYPPPTSWISGPSFKSPFLSPLLFFCLVLTLFLSCHFSADGPFSLPFFQKILKHFPLRVWLFCVAVVEQLGDGMCSLLPCGVSGYCIHVTLYICLFVSGHSFFTFFFNLVSVMWTKWSVASARPGLMCPFNKGDIEGANCLKFVYVCFVYVLWIDLRKGLGTRRVLKCAFVYDRVWLSWGDPVWLTGH